MSDMIATRCNRRIKGLTDAFSGIITQLEQHKARIERALGALREIVDGQIQSTAGSSGSKRRGRPAGVPNKRSEGQQRRGAAKNAGTAASAPVNEPVSKRGMSEQGRQKLAQAMKRRWAVKRAAAAAKKVTAKRPARTKPAATKRSVRKADKVTGQKPAARKRAVEKADNVAAVA